MGRTPLTVLEDVQQLELFDQQAPEGRACSCHWAGSVCVPLWASWRSAGCPSVAPQGQAAPAVEWQQKVRVCLGGSGLLPYFKQSYSQLVFLYDGLWTKRQWLSAYMENVFAHWSWLAQNSLRSQKPLPFTGLYGHFHLTPLPSLLQVWMFSKTCSVIVCQQQPEPSLNHFSLNTVQPQSKLRTTSNIPKSTAKKTRGLWEETWTQHLKHIG